MSERFFYHSFPRRSSVADADSKGCRILETIRDIGLLLMPEYIEWRQPTSGEPRILPILQKRICFTELSPAELPEHATKFGQFALEFDIDVLRRLGAIPVFYLPQPTTEGLDGNTVGVALLSTAMDATAVINRMAGLDGIFKGSTPVAEKLGFNPGFARNPDQKGNFTLDTAEAKNFLSAIGYMTAPWEMLHNGMVALLNFFYPADNSHHDRLLDYYRQREWRIACNFAIKGVEVLRVPTSEEKQRFVSIDPAFFGKQIKTDLNTFNALDESLVHPGLEGRRLIEMVRRVIVPPSAIEQAKEILKDVSDAPAVVSIDDLTSVGS
jgi:hypothetical protein